MCVPVTASISRSKLLIIEDNPAAADAIHAAVAESNTGALVVEWVRKLSEGVARLRKEKISAVLVNLFLPDSRGMETLEKVVRSAPDVPVLILGEAENETLAKQAVERGAQDYLLPGDLQGHSLQRVLRTTIEGKAVRDALFVEKERSESILSSIGDAVLCTDIAGNVTSLNAVAETMTGWRRAEACGRPLAEVFKIIDGATRLPARDPLERAAEKDQTVRPIGNCVLIRRDGFECAIEDCTAAIHDRAGHVIGAVIVFHDVSAARAMSLEMIHAAHHDCLTNLPNRLLLNDRIAQAISLARRQKRHIAVIFLDLDRFKCINDSLGHAVGDKLLQSVAKRLSSCVRGSDTVSRQGGDEFVVLLPELAYPEDAAASAEKLQFSLQEPHFIEGHDLQINGSIGISIYPEDGEDAESLIKNADTAMYHAKENGRNNSQFFKAEMNVKAVVRQSLEGSLRHAIERGEFLLHYQPRVNLTSGEITGVEALIRWQQPGQRLVLPAQFVPLAEDCGLILQIGRWVLFEACRQARAWQDAGLPLIPIAVNVSGVEFRNKRFLEGVGTILRKTNLEARYLELELTESVLMDHVESTTSKLQALKSMGVHIAVDDFGTGYSSLSYLRQFPIDILKIDQSFIDQMTSDPNDATIVSAVILMGKNLKRRVIAEGVKTRKQVAFLKSQQCTEGQGQLFSWPLGAAQFANLLQTAITKTGPVKAALAASRAV
jgi:diguanylate cyclase (GGDEF)-like protein/PAS domain S-box-containing protein